MLKDYSPNAAAHAARCKPDTLRDWRRLGFFNGVGERKGKGHRYTLSDVARVAVAAFIARNGASLRAAFEIVGQRGKLIDAIVAHERTSPGSADQFLTFTIDLDATFPAAITGAPIANIEFTIAPIGVLQVNVSKLIRSSLERLDAFDKWDADASAS
ncbi:helix-turn-helix domain-containing protein [Bradyrhizobium sp. 195]|uniref:helix-turn-helix domain-containing protein n=1 Tax=Bradyrhizobium sp. 195 TaxID=2782662 RepID=UPI002000C495|nr:helix-turn-helix domain-containing protein [Bradyrhizobium sp. 195]UPK25940.1 helix-turn-helix domain-containing protein [Bradyrhizobium sp. 195]